MTGRSLIASKTGIKLAKQALRRKRLTQKAFATDFDIASWSTINKFFNSKPIDRKIFLEICHFLDLDWEAIAQSFESTELETVGEILEVQENAIASLYHTVERNSTRTRTALNPYILPRLRRETLLEKCLKHIRIGIHEDKRRVIPILGAAGYGKSTILGTIYDELHQELIETETGWLALVRCDDLIESVENFALELGEKVSNTRQSIVEIAQQLTDSRGKGVLLIDTLDIILTKPLVPVMRGILSQLLELGTTVVFTCRDADYSDFFQPYHESFAGFRESVIDESNLDLTEVEGYAYKALKSENVLKDLGGNRIGFFHQTFLEYAIARWLNSTDTGELAFNQLKNHIITTRQTETRYYIWPIFRQVLTLVTLADFERIADELDKTTILPS